LNNDPTQKDQAANVLAVGVLGILGILVVPLPALLLDVLIAMNLGVSILILLVALRITRPLDFSVFPALLLIVTLYRLGLNVATTRLILGNGGAGGSGAVVKAFGEFAIGGSVLVGAVVFLILLVVNFVVITKGSGRVSEVAARFTLDALPGKQMSIDADLAAGAISDEEARRRRSVLSEESEFFGAMDGASKFVRGDAVAGLLITSINIVGGLVAGLARDGLGLGDALTTYTILTVGDGLVSQIPALVISTAAGVVITKAGSRIDLGAQLFGQILKSPPVLQGVAGVLFLVGFLPGMPLLIFGTLATAALVLARRKAAEQRDPAAQRGADRAAREGKGEEQANDRPEDLLRLDAVELEVGIGLVALIDTERGGELPRRVTALRKQLARDLGIVIPSVHLKDSLALEPTAYRILLRGMEHAKGQAYGDRLMVLDPAGQDPSVAGVRAVEPTFGLPARWITPSERADAESRGYNCIDPASVLTTHIGEVLRKNAAVLVGRQEVQELLGIVGKEAPKLVEDVVPGTVSLGELTQVVRGLLAEEVSVRDFRAVLEAVADAASRSKEPHALIDAVRVRLRRQITDRIADGNTVFALTLDRNTEALLRRTLGTSEGEVVIAPDLDVARQLIDRLEREGAKLASAGRATVVLAPPDLRRPLFSFASRFVPDLIVVSARELAPGTRVEPVGEVGAQLALAS
jgi:flagellar biosynthesis protein FlhA